MDTVFADLSAMPTPNKGLHTAGGFGVNPEGIVLNTHCDLGFGKVIKMAVQRGGLPHLQGGLTKFDGAPEGLQFNRNMDVVALNVPAQLNLCPEFIKNGHTTISEPDEVAQSRFEVKMT